MNRQLSAYLAIIRIVCAVVVVLSHLGHGHLIGGYLWPFTFFGNEAVMAFFVLSGFVIAFVTDQREQTFANVMHKGCLHVEEKVVFANRGKLTEQQKKSNQTLSTIRAVLEHPFRVLKRQSGSAKVHWRRLQKSTRQIVTLFLRILHSQLSIGSRHGCH